MRLLLQTLLPDFGELYQVPNVFIRPSPQAAKPSQAMAPDCFDDAGWVLLY